MQVGRGLRKSLVKPPAQSRDSCSSGLDLGGCSKPLRWETAQPLWATSSIVWLSSWWKFLLTSCLNISVSAYILCLSSSCHTSLWGAWLCLLDTLPILTEGLMLALPIAPATQSHLSSRLNKPIPPASPYGASALVLIVLVALHWSHCTLSMSFLYCRGQNWTQYTRCDLIVMDDLNKNITVNKEKKRQSQTVVNIPLRKKDSPKLTVITIGKYKEGKFQVRDGNGNAHSIPGSFNGQVWKCKQVASHLCLKVKWACTAKFSSRKHRVTYVYPEPLTPCEWMDSSFYYSFQWATSFLTHYLPLHLVTRNLWKIQICSEI